MKNFSYTKSGPGRKHTEPRKERDVRKDKLDSAEGKTARKYADRYKSFPMPLGKSKAKRFKGFRTVRKFFASGNHPMHPYQGMSLWVPA
jgi:hypothetical protein